MVKLRETDVNQMAKRFQQLCGFNDYEALCSARELAVQLERDPAVVRAFEGCAWEAVDQEVEAWDDWAREAQREMKKVWRQALHNAKLFAK